MKNVILGILLLLSQSVRSQSVDSTIIQSIDSLINVSRDLTSKSEFDKALEVNSVAENLALKKLGKQSKEYADCIFNHGRINYFQGDYSNAEKWYIESKSIRELATGTKSAEFAWSCNNLGLTYMELGLFDKSEPLLLQALQIRLTVYGEVHEEYASSLQNLANFYFLTGDYKKAEQFAYQGFYIFNKYFKEDYYSRIISLNTIATIYFKLGEFSKAENIYLEAIDLSKSIFGENHLIYFNLLNNLSAVYVNANELNKAETLLIKSNSGLEKRNSGHQFYFNTLINLGDLYFRKGYLNKSEFFFLKSKELSNLIHGKSSVYHAITLLNLALLYETTSYIDSIENYFISSINVLKTYKTLEYSEALKEFSIYNFNNANFIISEQLSLEASYNNRIFINKCKDFLSNQELLSLTKMGFNDLNYFYSISQKLKSNLLIQDSYNNCLFYKGFLQISSDQIKRLVFSDPITTEKYNLLKSLNYRLSKEYSKPILERDSMNIAELEESSNTLEKEITRTVAGFSDANRQVDWHEVQSSLKSDETAIEFVHYNYYNKKVTDSVMYAALILRPKTYGSTDSLPLFIPLFEQRQLESLMHTDKLDIANLTNNLYSPMNITSGFQTNKLYNLIWKPILDKIGNVKTIYYSPSGLLHRINLAAISIPESALNKGKNKTMADFYKLVNLNSTRDLVIPHDSFYKNMDVVIYGGINYNMDTRVTPEPMVASFGTRGSLSFQWTDSTLRTNNWKELPYSKLESESVTKLFTKYHYITQQKSGISATEESFKNLGNGRIPSPRILHLATHGYFFPDPKVEQKNSTILAGREPVFKISEHPMLRSGLIMAGGNAGWKGEKTLEGREDGVLTAYEISQLDLSHTELVVLSACETGLGDIQGFEGVYGLQRAFKIAGVKNIIMSLWQVDDEASSILMKEFYQNLLSNKKSIRDALSTAQNVLRNSKKFNSPYYWAGWVLLE